MVSLLIAYSDYGLFAEFPVGRHDRGQTLMLETSPRRYMDV